MEGNFEMSIVSNGKYLDIFWIPKHLTIFRMTFKFSIRLQIEQDLRNALISHHYDIWHRDLFDGFGEWV